ncbi:hypothetical protein HQ520_17625 [bacterium]|nr:hypothetical protein [bacterium]
MVKHLKWKEDFDKTIQRFEAWWHNEILDRPVTHVKVKPSRPYDGPVSTHATLRDRWLDAEFAVRKAIADLARQDYVGDTFPIYWPNVGPDLVSTIYGTELTFSDGTSWATPYVETEEDWERVLRTQPNFDNPYWRAIDTMTDFAIEVCDERYIIGISDLHGNYDCLSNLRNASDLCLDMLMIPDTIRRAGRHVSEGFVQCFNRMYGKLSAVGFGSSTFLNLYHEGPAYLPSCDFWYNVSEEMARDLIAPDILFEMQVMDRSVFHLDGRGALRHLDLICSWPELNAVDWVAGTGAGPAADWIDVYKRCQQAGKPWVLIAHDAKDALAVLDETGMNGVWVRVMQPFDTKEEAKAFVREIERRTAK